MAGGRWSTWPLLPLHAVTLGARVTRGSGSSPWHAPWSLANTQGAGAERRPCTLQARDNFLLTEHAHKP